MIDTTQNSIDRHCFYLACSLGKLRLVKHYFIKLIRRIRYSDFYNSDFAKVSDRDLYRMTLSFNRALHLACMSRNIYLVIWLIKKGANPMALDEKEQTPFEVACKFGHLKMAKQLRLYHGDSFRKWISRMKREHFHGSVIKRDINEIEQAYNEIPLAVFKDTRLPYGAEWPTGSELIQRCNADEINHDTKGFIQAIWNGQIKIAIWIYSFGNICIDLLLNDDTWNEIKEVPNCKIIMKWIVSWCSRKNIKDNGYTDILQKIKTRYIAWLDRIISHPKSLVDPEIYDENVVTNIMFEFLV